MLEHYGLQRASLRFSHEALISLNLGLTVTFAWLLQGTNALRFLSVKRVINEYLQLHPHSNFGSYIIFFTGATALAVFLFIALSVSSTKSPVAAIVLGPFAGILSVVAVPISWRFGISPFFVDLYQLKAALEVIVVAATVYVSLKLRAPKWI